MTGFQFRYRMNGDRPTVRDFQSRNGLLTRGDILNFEDGDVDVGAAGDTALVGAVLDVVGLGDGEAHVVRAIVDPDAVYAVDDPNERTAGTRLRLIGTSGGQGLDTSPDGELEVVADSSAAEETLVRIRPERHHSSDGAARPTGGELNAALARTVVRFYRDRFGRGPTRAQAFYRGNVIVVVLNDTMTKAERSLAAAGKSEPVLQLREAVQQSMRDDLAASVESLVGSKVIAFMSTNHIEPDMAAEIFVLEQPVKGEAHEAGTR